MTHLDEFANIDWRDLPYWSWDYLELVERRVCRDCGRVVESLYPPLGWLELVEGEWRCPWCRYGLTKGRLDGA